MLRSPINFVPIGSRMLEISALEVDDTPFSIVFSCENGKGNLENTWEIHVSPTSRVDIFNMRDPIGTKFIGDLDIALY